ncbi:apolipoprotein R-like isoform X2 [Monodon monoceros]|uniref:apolipoprotein R-like isoform X2 n=1 Tax=Monodon monoceros TaxID=40151 RepID=UPI0010F606E3|nr:apolipoprotein R-like isoform X2 [Monodon monoceros]
MATNLSCIFPALHLFGVLVLLLCPSCLCDCDMFPSIAHGSYEDVSPIFSFTTVVQYKCDEGYVLVGEEKITCRNSHWSSLVPQCKAMCLKPEIKDGTVSLDKNQYVESETVTVHCDSGYSVVGSPSISCSENRTWYPEVPKCEWVGTEDCEIVLKGQKLIQCISSPQDSKAFLELHKLSLEIEKLE